MQKKKKNNKGIAASVYGGTATKENKYEETYDGGLRHNDGVFTSGCKFHMGEPEL